MKFFIKQILPLLIIMAAAGYSRAEPINLYDEFFCPDVISRATDTMPTTGLSEAINVLDAADEVVVIETNYENLLPGQPFLLHDETIAEKLNIDITAADLSLAPVCFYCFASEPELINDRRVDGWR